MPARTNITAHQLDQDQDLLTELRILGSVRPQDRISTNHAVKPVVRIQKPEFFRSIYRFFGSESRSSNMAYIQSLLQRVIDRYTTAVHNGDMALQSRICEETESAIQGIRRLQQTYEDDAQFQASVNISVDTVCIHLGISLEEHDKPLLPIAHPSALRPGAHAHSTSPPLGIPGAAVGIKSTPDPFDYTHLPPAHTNPSSDTDSDRTGSVGRCDLGHAAQLATTPDLAKHMAHSALTRVTSGHTDEGTDDDEDTGSVIETF